MKRINQYLYQTKVERPFPGLTTHAYLLVRESGNVLFYNTGHDSELEEIERLGGLKYQLLSHRDELGKNLKEIQQRFGSKLAGHQKELDDILKYTEPDIIFSQEEQVIDGIKVIPTPGHSPGSVCFFVTLPDKTSCLFTGDTLYLEKGGKWKAGLLPGSDKELLTESLEKLKLYSPDLVISSAFTGKYGWAEAHHWAQQVDDAISDIKD